jgi:hypothetical protein
MQDLKIKSFRGKQGFYNLKDDWNLIVENIKDKTLFDRYEWHKSYIDTLDDNDVSVYFFSLYRANSPVAIFPIERREVGIFKCKYKILRIPDYCQADHPLFDFIYDKSKSNIKVIKDFITALSKNRELSWDCFFLSNILENSSIYFSLNNYKVKMSLSQNSKNCYLIKCESYNDTIKKYSKKHKANLRNAERRLLKLGKLKYIKVKKKHELEKYFKEFLDIEASGWKGKNEGRGTGEAIKQKPQERAWFINMIKNFSLNNEFEYNALKLDNKTIAGQFNLRIDDSIYGLKMVYDEKYSKCSPSNVLMNKVIEEYTNDSSINYFNTLTDALWVTKWKPYCLHGYNYFIFNKTILGFISFLFGKSSTFRKAYKKFFKRLK